MRDVINLVEAVDNWTGKSYPQFDHSLQARLTTLRVVFKLLKIKGKLEFSGYRQALLLLFFSFNTQQQ